LSAVTVHARSHLRSSKHSVMSHILEATVCFIADAEALGNEN